jgi:hypothetical protein
LNVRGGDRVLLNIVRDLTARMAHLADDEGAVLLGLCGELFEVFKALSGVF